MGSVLALVACTPDTPPASAPLTSAPSTSTAPVPVSGFPAQPAGVPFPTENWPAGEWPVGVDQPAIDRVVEAAFAGGADQRVRAVLIVHSGRLVYERYSPNPADGADVLTRSFSVAKSITSATVGIMVRAGKIDVMAPAGAPEWSGAGDPRAAITLDHLLRMSSGLEWTEDDLVGRAGVRDVAGYVASRPLAHPPGTQFNYSTGATFIVCRAMAAALGGGGQFTTFINAELFDKLGMNVTLSYDDAGTWLGGYAANATALDYAKFGLLYLRGGVWDGQRILPDGWVDYSRRPSPTNPEYGSGWWLDPARPGSFFALGALGQVVGVDPAHDLTFVITSTDPDRSRTVSDAIMTGFAG